MTDERGSLRTTVTLPDDGAGVHTLILDGVGAYGVGVGWEVRVRYPGRPLGGDDYATYLCCFEPTNDETTETDDVLITYEGLELGELTPDEDGGVFVPLPGVPYPLTDPGHTVTIEARSLKTGKVLTETLRPVPNPNVPGF